MSGRVRVLLAVALAAISVACGAKSTPVAPGAPHYPTYPTPDVPVALKVPADVRTQHEQAWARLQSGDVRGAERGFSALLTRQPAFYPAETGLGFTLLAEKHADTALVHFKAASVRNDRYLAAWQGQAEAQLALGNDAGAQAALEKILVIDPSRDAVRGRIDLLKFRQVQALLAASTKARDAGRLDEAQTSLEKAMTMSPPSAVLFRSLATIEIARGALDTAETHARRATQLDSNDADAFTTLGAVLEAKGRYRDAATAYATAAKIDPRPARKDRADAMRDKADAASLPAEFRALPTSATVTRAQLATLVGLRLDSVLGRAPHKVAAVVTDVRGHWAETWILPVTQAGVMDVFANHTFQPSAVVRRGELAQVVWRLLTLGAASDLAKWQGVKPAFADLVSGNVYYPPAALAIASGAMTTQDGDRFGSTRSATGAEAIAAIARVTQVLVR